MSIERSSQNAVADRAYQLWETAGRPLGRDLEFWLQAEAQFPNPEGREKATFASAQTVRQPAQVTQLKPTRSRKTGAK